MDHWKQKTFLGPSETCIPSHSPHLYQNKQNDSIIQHLSSWQRQVWAHRSFKRKPPSPQTPPNNFVSNMVFMLISVTIDDLNQRSTLWKITVKHNSRNKVPLDQETYLTNCCRIMLDEASLWLLDVRLRAMYLFWSSPLLSVLANRKLGYCHVDPRSSLSWEPWQSSIAVLARDIDVKWVWILALLFPNFITLGNSHLSETHFPVGTKIMYTSQACRGFNKTMLMKHLSL